MGAFFSSNSPPQLSDLTRCVAIVTGGNTGIGYYTVRRLAQHGAKVYMGARSEEKAKAAIEKLHAEGLGDKAGEVIWLNLDLTYPSKAKEAAEYILSREQRLDILINNAGKQVGPYSLTSDGISDSLAINHLSPFLFTNTLLPLMTATARLPDSDVRIVNLTSVMHSWAKDPVFNTLEAINVDFGPSGPGKMKLYSYTKLANILYAKELQKRLTADNIPIIVTAVHPGYVWTDGIQLYLSSLPFKRLWLAILYAFTISAERGADASVFAAASPLVRASSENYKGMYLVPVGKVQTPSKDAMDPQHANDLWEMSEKQLAVIGL